VRRVQLRAGSLSKPRRKRGDLIKTTSDYLGTVMDGLRSSSRCRCRCRGRGRSRSIQYICIFGTGLSNRVVRSSFYLMITCDYDSHPTPPTSTRLLDSEERERAICRAIAEMRTTALPSMTTPPPTSVIVMQDQLRLGATNLDWFLPANVSRSSHRRLSRES
jgi:hypothetical protein